MEGITLFFFNVVPGALLILILETKSNLNIMSQVFGIDPRKERFMTRRDQLGRIVHPEPPIVEI